LFAPHASASSGTATGVPDLFRCRPGLGRRHLVSDTVDPGFSRRDHKILRGEAVWVDDRQPPTIPVVEPAGIQLVPESRSGWSGAVDTVAGRFTEDAVDDLVIRW